MKYVGFIFFLLTTSCYSKNLIQSEQRSPSAAYPSLAQFVTLPKEKTLTFQFFRDLVQSGKVTTVAEALSFLKRKFPEHLQFHTLMYVSQSLQQASFTEPRAIVFGPNGKFIFTFNGGPHQRGGNAIETMEFTSETGEFKFREILFKKESIRRPAEVESQDVEFESKDVIISKPNPSKCTACHGRLARPIWTSYFLWPGAFGSNDDGLFQTLVHPKQYVHGINPGNGREVTSQNRLIVVSSNAVDSEVQGFKNYLYQKATHKRFSNLPDRIPEIVFKDFVGGTPIENLEAGQKYEKETVRLHSDYIWPARPNLYLTELIFDLVQESLIQRIKRENLLARLHNLNLFNEVANINELRVWPVFYAPSSVISKNLLTKLAVTSSQFENFYITFLTNAILMSCDTAKRLFEPFSPGALRTGDRDELIAMKEDEAFQVLSRRYSIDKPSFIFPKPELLNAVKKSNCASLTRIALSTPYISFDEVVLSFVLYSYGVDIRDYSPNIFYHPSFHFEGLKRVRQFIETGH